LTISLAVHGTVSIGLGPQKLLRLRAQAPGRVSDVKIILEKIAAGTLS
jgi:hypothetical protein